MIKTQHSESRKKGVNYIQMISLEICLHEKLKIYQPFFKVKVSKKDRAIQDRDRQFSRSRSSCDLFSREDWRSPRDREKKIATQIANRTISDRSCLV